MLLNTRLIRALVLIGAVGSFAGCSGGLLVLSETLQGLPELLEPLPDPQEPPEPLPGPSEQPDPADEPIVYRNGWYWHEQAGSNGTCVPTYVLIHGRIRNEDERQRNVQDLSQIANAIRGRLDSEPHFFDNANIAFWYWETRADTGSDWEAVYDATPDEGEALAIEILKQMRSEVINEDPDSVHIIGHGHGAYVGGFAGAEFQQVHGGGERLGQLTGLDAPGPWESADLSIQVDDESFHVVDWYSVSEDAEEQAPIPSGPLDDTGAPNVINDVECSITHSNVLDWYRRNRVASSNPWTSWVAPRVYRAPEVTNVNRWEGSWDYESFAQGLDYLPGQTIMDDPVIAQAEQDSASGLALDVSRVSCVGASRDRQQVVEVASGGAKGPSYHTPDTATLLRVPECLFIPQDMPFGNAGIFVSWFAETLGWHTASADARVVYEGDLEIHASRCTPDPSVVAWIFGSLITSGDASEGSYAVTINRESSDQQRRTYEYEREQHGAIDPRTVHFAGRLILLPALTNELVDEERAASVDFTALLEMAAGHSTSGLRDAGSGASNVLVELIISRLHVGPTFSDDKVVPDLQRFLVTPRKTVRLRTLLLEDIEVFGTYATVVWEKVAGPDGDLEPAGPVLWLYTPSSPGLHVLRVTITSDTDDAEFSVLTKIFVTGNVTVNGPATNAGADQAICFDQPATLEGSASDFATVLWTTAGDGDFDDATQLATVYTPGPNDSAQGSVVLTLTANPVPPCVTPASDTLTITINSLPTADAGDPQTICADQSAAVTGQATSFSSVLWTTAGDGVFDSATRLTTVYTPGTNDINAGSVMLTLTAEPLAPCTVSASDTVTITIQPLPTPTITAMPGDEVCEGTSVTLDTGPGFASYLWSTGENTQVIQVTEGGSYEVSVTDAQGCEGDDDIDVTVHPLPDATIAAAAQVCAGTIGHIASVPDAGPGATYDWMVIGGSITSGNGTSTITYAAGASGALTIHVTVTDANGCVGTDHVEVAVAPNPAATADDEGPYCEGDSIQLFGGPDGMSGYSWAGPNDFSSSEQNPTVSTDASVDMSGVYTLVVIDANGCLGAVDTVVEVNANPTPEISADAPLTACEVTTVTLDAGGPYDTYAWSTGETGTQTIDVTVTAPISGRWSESWAGGGPGQPGNVVHAASVEGFSLGDQWVVSGPALVDVQVMENTVDGGGNGYIVYQTTYAGGTLEVDPALWGGTGPMITADISGYTQTARHVYVSSSVDWPASWTDVTFNASSVEGPDLTVTAVESFVGEGDALPADYPGFLGDATEGQWGIVHAVGLGVTCTVTVTANSCEGSDGIVVTANAVPDCTITADNPVGTGTTNNVASLANAGLNADYLWEITGGLATIDSGNGTSVIELSSMGPAGEDITLQVAVDGENGCSKVCSTVIAVIGE